MPAAPCHLNAEEVAVVATVVIGIDPHKGSHTAVALHGTEALLGKVKVRATALERAGAGNLTRALTTKRSRSARRALPANVAQKSRLFRCQAERVFQWAQAVVSS